MILDEAAIRTIKRRKLFMNEYALRKVVEELIETLADYKRKYESTSEYVKNGRQS